MCLACVFFLLDEASALIRLPPDGFGFGVCVGVGCWLVVAVLASSSVYGRTLFSLWRGGAP